MPKEIERKFLVDLSKVGNLGNGEHIRQGYILTNNNTTVRVRIAGEKAFLTIKGKSVGMVRDEYEYVIPVDHAYEMLNNLCEKPFIDKTRYYIECFNKTWEIDIFNKENNGLIVAEAELQYEGEEIILPNWIVKEVTGESKYNNLNLVKQPFELWEKEN